MVLSLPQRHARMRRKLRQKQCRDEEWMIAQLDCWRLAVRPDRRHLKRTGREFLSIVWRQSVAAAESFHRLYPTICMIDSVFRVERNRFANAGERTGHLAAHQMRRTRSDLFVCGIGNPHNISSIL